MKPLKKDAILHIIRASNAITNCKHFVIIGTGAVIATAKTIPATLMLTRELDIYPTDTDNPEAMSDLIEGPIGEGSKFAKEFGYWGDGVSSRTAIMPDDWKSRAKTLPIKALP